MQEQRREITTAAGFGPPIVETRFEKLRREVPNFIRKNRRLLLRRAFWQILPQLAAARTRKRVLIDDGVFRFVGTHHKVMTTYFSAVLKLLGFGLGVPYGKIYSDHPIPQKRLVLAMHSKLSLPQLAPYRGVHIMRDPRDMIVSGYHYHKWTHETWARRPDDNGISYQQKLNQANKEEGLFLEINHFIFFYRDLLENWDLDDPDILEVAYEDLMGEGRDQIYHNIFSHLGVIDRDLDLAVKLMRLFEAGSRSGLKDGKVSEKSHLRSGRSGQWKAELNADHVAYIERELGSVLRKFGY
ncbi:sulfotransferase domain-containing protein [Ruegeria arenilitoris]|uniref:sulfotransferase domain-containing protein n=1 Tax=Ruegeria arenilitoris TaxID=1173585 RepID=UPI001479CEB6